MSDSQAKEKMPPIEILDQEEEDGRTVSEDDDAAAEHGQADKLMGDEDEEEDDEDEDDDEDDDDEDDDDEEDEDRSVTDRKASTAKGAAAKRVKRSKKKQTSRKLWSKCVSTSNRIELVLTRMNQSYWRQCDHLKISGGVRVAPYTLVFEQKASNASKCSQKL